MPLIEGLTAKERYAALEPERHPYTERAYESARYTIPFLFPRDDVKPGTQDHEDPFQSTGAKGLNNLKSKLLLTLFPPGRPFFRLRIEEGPERELISRALQAGISDGVLGEIEEGLRSVESAVMDRFEGNQTRARLDEVLEQLLVAGNALIMIEDDASLKVFTLREFVVKRDTRGQPIEIIVKETVDGRTLEGEARAIWKRMKDKQPEQGDETLGGGGKGRNDFEVDLYHYASWDPDDKKWRAYSEILEERIDGTDETWPKDKPRWLPIRWHTLSGEDYGRGFIEQFIGDLRSLEFLTQAVVRWSAAASKILFLVDEAGVTDARELANAVSGDFVQGSDQDISVLTLEKFADFQVANVTRGDIERRLSEAFLLDSTIQRDAERVTAEEIRFMAQALEQSLGGVYTNLADELQRPLVVLLMNVLRREDNLPNLPDTVVPQVVTGVEGLGRNAELQRLDALVAGIGQLLGPEVVASYLKPSGYIKRRAVALGFTNSEDFIRTEEEVRQIQKQQAMAQQAMAATGPGIQATGRLAEKQAELQAQRESDSEEV